MKLIQLQDPATSAETTALQYCLFFGCNMIPGLGL